MIGTLVLKDIKLFFRNQFFAVVTVLALVAFIILYFVVPNSVDNSLGIAIYIENRDLTALDELMTEGGSDATLFNSEEAMITALEESGDYFVGLSIKEDALLKLAAGEQVEFEAYYAPDIPVEAKQIFQDTLELLANGTDPAVAATFSRFNETEVVLGNDVLGTPLSFRQRFLPMILLMIMVTEVLGLATLLVREIEGGTARALITSPLRLHQFFASKALMGMGLAFAQVLLVVLITGQLGVSPLLLIVTLLLGTLLLVGLGFFVAAVSKDSTSVTAWGMFILILMIIPAISVMIPGLATGWMEIVPSFFFVDALHKILNFDANWVDVGRNLWMLLATSLLLIAGGTAVLRRRF